MLPTSKTLTGHCGKGVLWELHLFEGFEFGCILLCPYLTCDPILFSNSFTIALITS